MSRRATAADVARAAGVSTATVSLVLAGKSTGRVAEATRRAVEHEAQALGYRPDPTAQALRLGRPRTVAVVVPNAGDPFFAAVLRGAEEVARRRGYALLLVDVGNDRRWRRAALSTLAAHPVAGALFCSLDVDGEDLALLGRPAVVLDASSADLATVVMDVAGGMAEAVAHLVGLGHRRIAHLGASPAKSTFRRRRAAFGQSLARAGLDLPAGFDAAAPLTLGEARTTARRLLDQPARPTAVVCDDDLLAAATYKAAGDLGLDVPADCSVTGFGGGEIAEVLSPELSTVALPAADLARQGMRSLLALLDPGSEEVQTRRLLPTALRHGGSTAPPPPAPPPSPRRSR